MSTATPARIPLNAYATYSLFLNSMMKNDNKLMMMKDGNTTPKVAISDPQNPLILYPIKVAELTANTPGVDSEMTSIFKMSSSDAQFFFSTTSLCMTGIMA